MVCEHLAELEKAIISSGARETARGRVWTKNCREWAYFDVVLDIPALQKRFRFAPCVRVHENMDPKSGTERGFECTRCRDAVMGLIEGGRVFR